MDSSKPNLALVIGCLPTIEEIDQLISLAKNTNFKVITSESIGTYIHQNSYFQDLTCVLLSDHDENPSFLPGLESALKGFDYVIVKERIGLYAYQVLKAKWSSRFKMFVWLDNLVPFPANDIDQMRTIRSEVSAGADGFIVQTDAARSVLELENIESERIFRLTPSVATQFETSGSIKAKAREILSLSESDLVICAFGQIEWEESLQDLMAAVKLLITSKPSLKDKIKILICGIGSFASELKEASINFGSDYCVHYYAPNRETTKTIIQAADLQFIATMPGRDRIEGDPFRYLSAMCYGIPVVANRSPMAEATVEKHRLDFCAGSPVSLAQALKKVINGKALVKDISNKNRDKLSRRFNPQKTAEELSLFVKSFCESNSQVDPNQFDHLVSEVEAKIKAKQYVESIDLIEKVFADESLPLHHRANLYRMIGDCFVKMSDFDAAKNAYNTAIELDPFSSRTYIGLGTVGLMKNSCDVSVLHFQKAVSLAPDDDMANLGLGLAFQGMSEWEESIKWLSKSLQYKPENSAALFSLVKSAHESDCYEEAEKCLLNYLEKHPHDDNFLYALGGIYHKLKRYDDVQSLMDRILVNNPADEKAKELNKEAAIALDHLKANTSNG